MTHVRYDVLTCSSATIRIWFPSRYCPFCFILWYITCKTLKHMYIKLYITVALRYPTQFGHAGEQQQSTLDFLHLQVVLRWPFFIPDAVRSHAYHSIVTAVRVCVLQKYLWAHSMWENKTAPHAGRICRCSTPIRCQYASFKYGTSYCLSTSHSRRWLMEKTPCEKRVCVCVSVSVCASVCVCVWLSKSALYQRTSITQFLWAVCFQSQQTAGPAFRTHED